VEEVLEEEGVQLSDAYWRWIRDQMYEGQIMGRSGRSACSPVPTGGLELSDGTLVRENFELNSLSSGFEEVDPQWDSDIQRDLSIDVQRQSGGSDQLRAKAFVGGVSQCEENGRTGLKQKIEDVSGDEKVYVLVSNTSTNGTQFQISLEIVVEVPSPRSLRAQSRDSSASLTWQPPENPPSSFTGEYKVYRSTSEFEDPSEATLAGEEIPEGSFTDTRLENGQTYYYRVTAVYEAEDGTNLPFESDPTSQVEVKPLPEPPDRP